MVVWIIFSIFYLGSISYNGLGADFTVHQDKIWVSFPFEDRIISYSTNEEIKIKNPYALFSYVNTLYVVSNTDKKLYEYENLTKISEINLTSGFYVKGMRVGNKIYLLERETPKIVEIEVYDLKGSKNLAYGVLREILLDVYQPIDFKLKDGYFYILDRKDQTPSIRLLKLDLNGNIVDTIFEKIGTVGGGVFF